jgi:hypothetical protein
MTTSLGIIEHEQADIVHPCNSTGEPTPAESALVALAYGALGAQRE